jgi:hypothetical protein
MTGQPTQIAGAEYTWNTNPSVYGSGAVRQDSSSAPLYLMQPGQGLAAQAEERGLIRGQGRMDSGGNSVFPYGDLTHVLGKVLNQRHPPLTAAKHFGISREAGWNDFIELSTINDHGEAKFICCSNDFPRVSIEGASWKAPFVTFGSGYEICYTTLKSQQVSKARINYEANLMRVAYRAMREKANKLAYYGDSSRSILGLANNTAIPQLVSPFKLDATSTASPQSKLAVLTDASCQSYVRSDMANNLPNAMIGPPRVIRSLMKTLLSTTGDSGTSILGQFAMFAPNITYFGEAPEMENIGPGGEAGLFFYRRDRDCMELHYPIQLEVLQPFWTGYSWQVNMISRIGSLWTYYPEDCLLLLGV